MMIIDATDITMTGPQAEIGKDAESVFLQCGNAAGEMIVMFRHRDGIFERGFTLSREADAIVAVARIVRVRPGLVIEQRRDTHLFPEENQTRLAGSLS